VAVPDVPIPYARDLEYAVLPTPARIEAAVREALPSKGTLSSPGAQP
jgi:pyruvate dehydrogenase E1 component beta subunit